MTSITLHLRPHCIKYLVHHIFDDSSQQVVSHKRMLRHLIDALIEPRPLRSEAKYKYQDTLEYPIPARVIKKPNIHPHRKELWITPESMNLIDQHVDSLFRFEFCIAATYHGYGGEISEAIAMVMANYGITEADFSLHAAVRHERRNRFHLNTLKITA